MKAQFVALTYSACGFATARLQSRNRRATFLVQATSVVVSVVVLRAIVVVMIVVVVVVVIMIVPVAVSASAAEDTVEEARMVLGPARVVDPEVGGMRGARAGRVVVGVVLA